MERAPTAYAERIDRAVVTGVAGTVGSRVADRLADAGVDVVGIDRDRPAGTRSHLSVRVVDLREQGPTWETVHEVDPDAVVHCAALSDPLATPGTRVFENNTASTYNALIAAGRADAEVVWTSSQAAYGALFAESSWLPDYLPIDEGHPLRPEDPYGVSKVCSEEIARMVARRYGMPVTTLRPATVREPDEHRSRPRTEAVDFADAADGGNFGSFVDVRDVVGLIEAALSAERTGHEAFLCVADENYLGPPTAELVESICGDLPAECELTGQESALSNAKAKARLDWEPVYSSGDADDRADPPAWR